MVRALAGAATAGGSRRRGGKRALWTRSPAQRRAEGSALGGLRLAGEPRQTERGEWEYTFPASIRSELREGDAILLSDGDPVRGEVVTGTILRLSEHGLTVWTPERIADPALIDRYESEIIHDRTARNLWRWLDAEAAPARAGCWRPRASLRPNAGVDRAVVGAQRGTTGGDATRAGGAGLPACAGAAGDGQDERGRRDRTPGHRARRACAARGLHESGGG